MLKQDNTQHREHDRFDHRAKAASKNYRQLRRQVRELEFEEMLDEDIDVRNAYQGVRIR